MADIMAIWSGEYIFTTYSPVLHTFSWMNMPDIISIWSGEYVFTTYLPVLKHIFSDPYGWYNGYMIWWIYMPTYSPVLHTFSWMNMPDIMSIWSGKYIFTTYLLVLKHIFLNEYRWYSVHMIWRIYICHLFTDIEPHFPKWIWLIQCIYDLANIYSPPIHQYWNTFSWMNMTDIMIIYVAEYVFATYPLVLKPIVRLNMTDIRYIWLAEYIFANYSPVRKCILQYKYDEYSVYVICQIWSNLMAYIYIRSIIYIIRNVLNSWPICILWNLMAYIYIISIIYFTRHVFDSSE
jgi:hypothetical protein